MTMPAEGQLAANVRRSTSNAREALGELHLTLVRSGMAEARATYRQLVDILMEQSIWATEHSEVEALNNLRGVSQTSSEIIEILDSYVDLLRPLADDLPAIVERGSPELAVDDRDPHPHPLVGLLASAPTDGLSYSTLKHDVGLSKRELDACLDDLEAQGIVKIIKRGGRNFVALSAD